jgi:AraC-like DNA-binding protein
MAAGEEVAAIGYRAAAHPATDASTLTLNLSPEALGALDAYLRSGAARGLPFEQPLREALFTTAPPAPRVPPVRRRSALSQRTLRQVQEFVQANLARDIRIEHIAQAAFLSPFHLGRRYREATGESLWQYVLRCRAQRAAALISGDPEIKLADVAAQCGFESYSQFIAAFRKTYGFTPGGLKRLLDQAAH